MQTKTEDQLVGHVLGQYRVERFVGRGRLQTVYLARHQALQRIDALTLYSLPEHFSNEARTIFLTRFRKEASSITSLDHPHILPVYTYGEALGSPYLITPYNTNGSLADVVKHQGRCEHTFVTSLLNQMVDGLAYAHARGFVHGTLKPSNVVVQDDENIQVAGFGLMHILQRSGVDKTPLPYAHLLSIGDTFLAAAEYVAPEIVQGQAVDQRSDIYALGCILYELLSGRPPFSGNNPLEVAQMHTRQAFPALRKLCPDIPVALVSVVNQALSRDPDARFQSIRELGEAFTQASIGATQSVPVVRMQRMSAPAPAHNSQEMPRHGSSMGNWQLVPPIVTGHLPAIGASTREKSRRDQAGQTSYRAQTGPVVVPVPPTIPPAVPQDFSMAAKPQVPDEDVVALLTPGVTLAGTHATDAELMKAYEWWSPAEPVQPASVAAPAPSRSTQTPAAPVVLPSTDMLDWGLSDVPATATTKNKKRPQQGSPSRPSTQKMKRRSVVALLASGVVVAGGVGLAFNLGKLTAPPMANQQVAQQQPAPAKNPPQKPAQNPPAKPQNGGNTAQKPAAPGHVGTVIGSQNQPVNSAISFNNPADQQASLLVHLPSGTFAAYEKACTHEGVKVNYDPATRMFVCPAHGAIFDPANGGRVVRGPADAPLPPVKVNVNADGTITAV